jgi:hypothetical protein
MFSEMWMTSAYNVMSRTSWLSGAMPGSSPTGQAAMSEWQRMWSEKLLASMEVGMELQRAGYQMMLGSFNPWHTGSRMLAPLHRRSVSNSRRLARRQAGA